MALYHRLLLSVQQSNVTLCYVGEQCSPPSPPTPALAPAPALGLSSSPAPAPALGLSSSPAPAPALGLSSPGPAPALGLSLSPAPSVVPGDTYDWSALPVPPPPIYPRSSKHDLTRNLVIIVASVLAACALFLIYYYLRRYRSSRRRRRAQAAPAAAELQQTPFDDDLRQDLLVGGGPEEPYHVWYIRTAGLDEPTIGAIAAYVYRRGEGVVEGTDCAVCLGEFRDGEMLRLLPKCSHAFHVPCVDTWLRCHVNCPLCRAPILAPPQPPARPHAVVDVLLNPASPSSSSASAAAPGVYPHGSGNSHRYVIPEGGDDGGDAAVAPSPARAVPGHHPGSSFSDEASEVWVPIDLGNGPSEEEAQIESHASAAAEENGRAGLHQMRCRSVSMDSFALGGLLLRMGLTGRPTLEGNPSATKNGERQGNSCKGAPWTERSVSSGGARIDVLRAADRILPL